MGLLNFENVKVGEDKREMKPIKETLRDLEEATVSHLNYTKYVGTVKNKLDTIETTISYLMEDYNAHVGNINDMTSEDNFQDRYIEEGVVPLDLFEELDNLASTLEQVLQWKAYQAELLNELIDNFSRALGEVKGQEIEREVTENHRKIMDEHNELIKEALVLKQQQIDEKVNAQRQLINERLEVMEDKLQRGLLSVMVKLNRQQSEAFKDVAQAVETDVSLSTELEELKEEMEETVKSLSVKTISETDVDERAEKNLPDDMSSEDDRWDVDSRTQSSSGESDVFPCDKQGCDEQFPTAKQLEQHQALEHAVDDSKQSRLDTGDEQREQPKKRDTDFNSDTTQARETDEHTSDEANNTNTSAEEDEDEDETVDVEDSEDVDKLLEDLTDEVQ